MATQFAPTGRTRLRRRPQRGAYDKETVYAVLDAHLFCHVGYVLEGEAFVTPTAFWRAGDRLFWHGSAASRALAAQADGQRVCVTVSHLDGLVLGRSGFTHSVLYRSVMAFGHPVAITAGPEKRRAMDAFIGGLYPRRPAEVRPAHEAELAAIVVLSMAIEEASAKIRGGGVNEVEADLNAPCWAGVVPIAMTVGAPLPDPALLPGIAVSPSIAAYRPGARLEDALAGRNGSGDVPPGGK
jgi:hypothetical protein